MAKRDNARVLFKSYIDAAGGELQADAAFLAGLKQAQEQVLRGRGGAQGRGRMGLGGLGGVGCLGWGWVGMGGVGRGWVGLGVTGLGSGVEGL